MEKFSKISKNSDNKYMFHGSCKKLTELIPMQSNDSGNNKSNIDKAVFLTNDFLSAVPYAFKDTIKENSKGLCWSFTIPTNATDKVKMTMKNVRIDESITGFVYVFEKTDDMVNDPKGSNQWKCYHSLKPIHVFEVAYKDYSKYFQIEKQGEQNETNTVLRR